MLYERRVKVKLDLTLQQPFTNVVITLCASWEASRIYIISYCPRANGVSPGRGYQFPSAIYTRGNGSISEV